MNPIKFYNIYTSKHYLISSFTFSNFKKNTSKLNNIKINIILKNNINKNIPIIYFLIFCILTKTKPFFIKGLKNYKENKVTLKGINICITKNIYYFLDIFINEILIENRDAIKKIKKEPSWFNVLIFDKLIINNSVDAIYDLSNINRNSHKIDTQFSLNLKKNIINQNIFLFNSLINKKYLPKVLN